MDMGDDVRGESKVEGYGGKIELLSFSHGVAMQITGDLSDTDRTSNRPIHQDLSVTKYLDSTSPVLFQNCCEGKIFKQVDIIIGRNEGGKVTELMSTREERIIPRSQSAAGAAKGVEGLTSTTPISPGISVPEIPPRAGRAVWGVESNDQLRRRQRAHERYEGAPKPVRPQPRSRPTLRL